jgi:hypothetical protein
VRVEGEVVIPSGPGGAGTLRVSLVEVSRQDVPAVRVAERTFQCVAPDEDRERVHPFSIEARPRRPQERFAVEAHLDFAGDGRIRGGDYVNVQSHPVGGSDPPPPVRVILRRVE